MRKIAAHRIVLPSGQVLSMHVVTLDENGKVIEFHPLHAEEPFVEWYNGQLNINN